MQAAPVRFLNAVLWPVTIWTSITHFNEHPTDDYVERTSPIVGTAVAFWACVAVLVTLSLGSSIVFGVTAADGAEMGVHHVRRGSLITLDVMWFFLPLLYISGLWMFAVRAERFPR
jgi:hypothetical protein